MKRIVAKILIVSFFLQLLSSGLLAQNRDRRSDAAGEASSGLSFRKDALEGVRRLGSDGKGSIEEMTSRNMMMTEPSMSSLTYQVHVLGEVYMPGTYRITASDRLSEVLTRAGGVNEQGSQRIVEVRRKNDVTRKVDILSFLLFGDLTHNPYLLDNDVIFVPLKKSVIQVAGSVRRPMEYEIKNEKSVADVIKLAGGFSVGAAKTSSIKIIRFEKGEKKVINVENSDEKISSFDILAGDVVYVPNIITERNQFDYDIPNLPGDKVFYPSYEDRVFVLGAVQSPGPYQFSPYYTIDNYITLAGGLTTLAKDGSLVIRKDGTRIKVKDRKSDKVVVNPGDTIKITSVTMEPYQWLSFAMGFISFALSTTTTVLVLTDR